MTLTTEPNGMRTTPRTIPCDIDLLSGIPGVTQTSYTGIVINGRYSCSSNRNINSLKGSPKEVTRNFDCSGTRITSLRYSPKIVGVDYMCYGTEMTTLRNVHKHVHHIGNGMYIPNTIRSNILGLLKIRNLRFVSPQGRVLPGDELLVMDLVRALEIINRYLNAPMANPNIYAKDPYRRMIGLRQIDIHKAQEEMIEAGLEAYAQL